MALGDDMAAWDAQADAFDQTADHGLRDPAVRQAWREILVSCLPEPPARIADLGCGTGTLSVLLAEAGYQVDGLDFSPRMVEIAERKAGSTHAGRGLMSEWAAGMPMGWAISTG